MSVWARVELLCVNFNGVKVLFDKWPVSLSAMVKPSLEPWLSAEPWNILRIQGAFSWKMNCSVSEMNQFGKFPAYYMKIHSKVLSMEFECVQKIPFTIHILQAYV